MASWVISAQEAASTAGGAGGPQAEVSPLQGCGARAFSYCLIKLQRVLTLFLYAQAWLKSSELS